MRNYLFDRPTGPGATPAPVRPAIYTPVPAKARRRSPLPWLICFASLILALLVTFLIWSYHDGVLWSDFQDNLTDGFYDVPSYDSSDRSTAAQEETLLTSIPRAPTGDGTTLTIHSDPGAALTANAVYEKALPSVVSIEAYSSQGVSCGSGIIMSEDGYILTNYHIINGCSSAWVYPLTESYGYEAMLVGYAADLDLAVLKVDASGLTPAEFCSSRTLSVGDTVYALGNPLGYLYGSLTEGIVSAMARNITVEGYQMSLIQTSAALNSGNSGGALLNSAGQVVGITSAKITSGTEITAEGLGLAIPISDIRGCVNSIIACGDVITPRIGIMCYSSSLNGVSGILVDSVDEGGPADEAGLFPGDFITTANGIPVASVEELKDIFYDVGIGGSVELTVMRLGKELTLTMILAE